jgi:hypothetical protein
MELPISQGPGLIFPDLKLNVIARPVFGYNVPGILLTYVGSARGTPGWNVVHCVDKLRHEAQSLACKIAIDAPGLRSGLVPKPTEMYVVSINRIVWQSGLACFSRSDRRQPPLFPT